MNAMIDATEAARLDDLTAYNSTILNHLHGEELEAALAGECKRYGKSDSDFRTYAINSVHPDDMFRALASKGLTLAKFGIQSVTR
jgi:hypothetical protein